MKPWCARNFQEQRDLEMYYNLDHRDEIQDELNAIEGVSFKEKFPQKPERVTRKKVTTIKEAEHVLLSEKQRAFNLAKWVLSKQA